MAIVRAVKTGVWSDVTVWNTGALPTSADDVYSNTFTVTIDVSPTVLSISNAAATGVTAGGQFFPANGITLTCTAPNGVVGSSASVDTIYSTLTIGQSCTITANLIGGSASVAPLAHYGTGTINIVGNVSSPASGGGYGAQNRVGGTLNITGNVTANGGNAVWNIGTGLLNVTGNVVAIANGFGIYNFGTGPVIITGSVTAGTGGYGVQNNSSGTITITGSIQPNGTIQGIFGANGSTYVLTGPFLTNSLGTNAFWCPKWFWANSSVSPTYYQIRSANLATIRPLYTADSVGGNPAITNVRSGTVFGPAGELTGTCAVPAAASVVVGTPVDATVGTAVITAATLRSAMGLASANLDTQLSGINTNVSALPSAATIASTIWQSLTSGLNTVGSVGKLIVDNINATISSRLDSSSYTAPLDSAGTRSALGLASANLDTQLAPLPNLDTTVSSRLATSGYTAPLDAASTRSAVGLASANLDAQLAPLPNLDATVSSRLATTSYQAPLDASETRTAIGLASANLDTQLSGIDTNVSSRSTFNPATDTVANVTLVDTTTNLTNPPDVPTTAEIATAVANELEPTLTGIDNDILSRLASVDYTVPPTAEQNAGAVRIELTPELSNLDVAVSTRSTFDPVTDTVANVTLVDTTTNLTNPPDVPTTAEIATAVSDALDPTLTQIDNDVLSRLATEDYTTPPTAEQNAEAVRVELTPELGRVANCATVATTGQQIQNALST